MATLLGLALMALSVCTVFGGARRGARALLPASLAYLPLVIAAGSLVLVV